MSKPRIGNYTMVFDFELLPLNRLRLIIRMGGTL